jgi:hypothetical protein
LRVAVGVPLALFGGGGRKLVGGELRISNDWRDDPASEKQKSFARDLGIRFPAGITKGELSDLISEETAE